MRVENIKPIPRLVLILAVIYGIYYSFTGIFSTTAETVSSEVRGAGHTLSKNEAPSSLTIAPNVAAMSLAQPTMVASPIIVEFDGGGTRLKGSSKNGLSAALTLAENSANQIVITGHTDDRGSAATNYSLGKRRANAVLAWMREHSRSPIPDSRVQTKSKGATAPTTPNNSELNRSRNRRVEISFRPAVTGK